MAQDQEQKRSSEVACCTLVSASKANSEQKRHRTELCNGADTFSAASNASPARRVRDAALPAEDRPVGLRLSSVSARYCKRLSSVSRTAPAQQHCNNPCQLWSKQLAQLMSSVPHCYTHAEFKVMSGRATFASSPCQSHFAVRTSVIATSVVARGCLHGARVLRDLADSFTLLPGSMRSYAGRRRLRSRRAAPRIHAGVVCVASWAAALRTLGRKAGGKRPEVPEVWQY